MRMTLQRYIHLFLIQKNGEELEGLQKSIKMTLNEHNTLLDDVIKNFENYEEIKAVVHQILVADLYS